MEHLEVGSICVVQFTYSKDYGAGGLPPLIKIYITLSNNCITEFTHSVDEFGLILYFKKPETS
jgi:hypothetical protein